MIFFVAFFIVLSMGSFVNFITILKKIKSGQDAGSEIILGTILIGILAYCFVAISAM